MDDLWAANVLDVDEGIEVLDRDDHQRVDANQNEIIHREAGRKAYVQDYTKKRQSILGVKPPPRNRKAT